ncbi:N-formyl peptide receptor 2 [Biomphalaria pfeifferi]|uniref:N-formyl peptide receptor 2 n=1 Tax=Biomphalaria pfeifferi TaxID=112525 RepID=A0AAD8AQN3_BIOPF|nr:N-formyl peptide receptor 2 [Biomphalaria pfeifferi]
MKSSNMTSYCCSYLYLVNVTSVRTTFDQILVSDHVLATFTSVVDTWFSLVIALLGILGNILTIVVFTTMGFKETINITMTTIAFWDLVRVLCGVVHRCYGPLSLLSLSLGRSWPNATYPHVNCLQNIAYVIGGYVALERCLCISVPLQVKESHVACMRYSFGHCAGVPVSCFVYPGSKMDKDISSRPTRSHLSVFTFLLYPRTGVFRVL